MEGGTAELQALWAQPRWDARVTPGCRSESSSLLRHLGKQQRMAQVCGPPRPRGRPGWDSWLQPSPAQLMQAFGKQDQQVDL